MGRRKKIDKELLESSDASPEARGYRVKRVRNMANLSRQDMCNSDDININSLKGWEIGRYGGLTGYGAEKIIKRISQEGVQCTIDWLMYGVGAGPTVQTGFSDIKLNSEVSSATETIEDENTKIANELLLFKKHYKHSVNFIVNDDGMLPIFKLGEYVAGINLFGKKIDKAINEYCIVQLENGKILLRHVRKGLESETYTLACINGQTEIERPMLYDVKLISAAPVIFHRKKTNTNE